MSVSVRSFQVENGLYGKAKIGQKITPFQRVVFVRHEQLIQGVDLDAALAAVEQPYGP